MRKCCWCKSRRVSTIKANVYPLPWDNRICMATSVEGSGKIYHPAVRNTLLEQKITRETYMFLEGLYTSEENMMG